MKINLEKAKEEFLIYTKNFDISNENIKRKQLHSLRVMQISEEIAKNLNLKKEDVELAKLIGLLHDVARFEQYTKYQTYNDSISFDHGDYALKILEKDIRKYIQTDEFDEIIKKAIKNHNKYKIEEGLNSKEELFAKIIRDADKIDILYESGEIFWKGLEKEIEESKISEEIFKSIKEKRLVKRSKDLKFTKVDSVVVNIAFIFDLNFTISYKIIYEKDYINKILNKYDIKDEKTRKEYNEIKEIINNYLREKIIEN